MTMTKTIEPPFSLPARPLLAASAVACAAAAIGWVTVTLIAGYATDVVIVGVVTSGLMLVGAWVGLMAVRPGKTRRFSRGVLVWIGTFPLQAAVTLGLCLVLYSAARASGTALLLSFLVASLATLVGQTWVCVAHLRKATGEFSLSE